MTDLKKMSKDLEKDVVKVTYIHGYPSLAAFIARDSSVAIYRRFDYLSARALLYMQSELCELESELMKLEEEDLHDTEGGANEPHRDWKLFQLRSQDTTSNRWKIRMTLVKLIQEKLKTYRVYNIPNLLLDIAGCDIPGSD